MLKKLITGIFITCCYFAAFSQSADIKAGLLKFTTLSDSLANKYPAEKIYVQFDKPAYTSGDTIWLKAYLINAVSHYLSSSSGLLHIDIANDSNKIIKQYLLPLGKGLTLGNIALDEKDFKPGDYTLRAYTNWMRNFGEGGFYYKSIRIAGADEQGWLVNSKIDTVPGKLSTVRARLQLTGMDKTTMADSTLQAEVISGKKVLYKQKVQTDNNSLLDMNFVLPPKANNSTIVIQNKSKTKRAIIPIMLDKHANIDLQFMPEGGSLVAGLPAHVAFKAIGEDGKGIDVYGTITDQKDSMVATFNSLHKGIGSFYINVQPGESYRARLSLGGIVKEYPLPVVKNSGTILQVKDISNDSLEVIAAVTADMSQTNYYLIGKARGVVCYAALVDFVNGNSIRSKIAKNIFPTGITHFILMTPQKQPLNDRLVYIDHHDGLHINIDPASAAYALKDSVALHISVTNAAGNPVKGIFSLAVTDDGQIKTDSLSDDNILTHTLLTSDLNGYVEEQGYYFQQSNTAKQSLDNLLLTQGWVSYEPMDIKMPYAAETEYKVSGRVNNVFNKGIKKADIVLLSKSPAILMDTVTDNKGRFVFDHFPRVDTPVFIIKTNNRDFNVNIDMDETVPPVFNTPKTPLLMPWYMNTDSTLMNFVKSSTQMKQQDYYPGGGRVLKEVKITAKKTVKGSYNLNGPGNADIVLDEKQLENSGKKNWRKLFEENIRGFREVDSFALVNNIYVLHKNFYVYEKPLVLLVDGVMVSTLFNIWDFRQFIEFHDAEDVKGIEVITSTKYTAHYMRVFFPQAPLDSCVFVEVTTRSGNPLIKNTPGLYLYKPLAISWPKQFYKPKYTVKDTAKTIDLRSTIDWEPNIVTDTAGHATISFYAASRASTYTIIAEGVDLNGNIGYKRRKISIVVPKEITKSK